MYEVIFDSVALKFLEKTEKKIAKRIWEKILLTKENPHRFFERLTGRKDYKLRVGEYRIIADIDNHQKKILITYIDHRGKVYKRI